MNVNIYIESEKLEFLNRMIGIVYTFDESEQDPIFPIFFQNVSSKGWIQVSISYDVYIALLDRSLISEIIEL